MFYIVGQRRKTVTGWIRCDLLMPEKDGRYLVVEDHPYYWIGVTSLRQGKWDSIKVTHWQTLPGLPKGIKIK